MIAGLRAFVLAYGTWLILAPWDGDDALVGLAAAALAGALTRALAGSRAGAPDACDREAVLARPLGALAYFPGAVWRAFLGGMDVVSRVLRPKLPIAPAFMRHGSGEAAGRPVAGAVFSGVISLMPGTMAAGRDTNGRLWVHLLAADDQAHAVLDAEHQRVDHVIPPRRIAPEGRP
ncbi:MAG: Na+/H+ antiporter subunit E [Alphaproteobacteria bacterium]